MSSTSTIPLWGQAWELTVQYAQGGETVTSEILSSSSFKPSPLRMTFDILEATIPSPWWFADISVYNLNTPEIQNALLNATWVTLKAGFQTGPNLFSIVWDGPVLQTLIDRERVVDTRITFHCVANPLVMDQIVNFSMGPFSSQQQLIARMAAQIDLPAMSNANGTVGSQAEQILTANQYPRGRGVFGKVGKYMTQIANSNFLQSWRDGQKQYISEMTRTDLTPDLIYCPPQFQNQAGALPAGTTSSIIGTPRQTPFGVIFQVLLDPRLKVQLPPLIVQLTRTLIAQLPVTPGQTVSTPLSSNLTFLVGQVRHRGDTRGNTWETEVTGFSTTYAANLLNGIFSANAGG